MTPIRSTRDAGRALGSLHRPVLPLKIESAACTVKTGLPVAKTLDW